jgi:hypothetical protein
VRAVTEEHEVRQFVDELERDFPAGQIRVTGLALRQSRKAGPIGALGVWMTEDALLFEWRVLLVVERANVGR